MDFNIIFPKTINCDVNLPASKSISNRVLILNALSQQKNPVYNIAKCDDTRVMQDALSSESEMINIGAAGTAMRFLTGYFAMQRDRTVVLDGSDRMRQRPIKILVEALIHCGADIDYTLNEGYPPIQINGRQLFETDRITLPGNVSSQYVSSLMMISPLMDNGLVITLTGNLLSVPYIDMTLELMRIYGVEGERRSNVIIIPPGVYNSPVFKVESDWSAASYWYEIVSLLPKSKVFLEGLSSESIQGDSAISKYFELFGVHTEFENGGVTLISSEKKCERLEIDLTSQPDLAQTIAVTSCLLKIPFNITGLSTLKIKETDRIAALISQLRKLGYFVAEGENCSLVWSGEMTEKDEFPKIETFEDHRMAMAFAPASIKHSKIKIQNIEVVSKSYPEFWTALEKAGVQLIRV